PGLLVKDLMAGDDAQIAKVVAILQSVRPDILLINEFDYDASGVALGLFREALQVGDAPLELPHGFLAPTNTGEPSGVDLDGDGSALGPADAFGYGRFPGQYGMALLSRFPVAEEATATFQNFLWKDLPEALLPVDTNGAAFPSEAAHAIARLSSKSHWDVAIDTPEGRLRIFASHPTPPVFDGPEDYNGRRNHDEIRFWQLYLDGAELASDGGQVRYDGAPFVILGDLNADPKDGDGRLSAINALLTHPLVQDPRPASTGGVAAAEEQAGANRRHLGPPALDTADWNDARGPGNLRVDYALPARSLDVSDAGVFWPAPGAEGAALVDASDHRLVWVDIEMPRTGD
ncbi:MAG: endonuclease/exonuclease/phosphatase family protein, partial [Pseudomonadota bacterium]